MYLVGGQPPVLPGHSDFTVAIATIDRPITARFEGYLGVLATLSAFCGKHLASGAVLAVSITL